MGIERKTLRDIKALAIKAAKDAGVYCSFPVDVETVVKSLGYNLKFFVPSANTNDISGAVNHDDKTVYVNSTESARRKMFTVAHEVGHIVLHPNENMVDYRRQPDDQPYDPREYEANTFAAELLMPEREFKNAWITSGGDLEEVALYFGVSTHAAMIRAEKVINS